MRKGPEAVKKSANHTSIAPGVILSVARNLALIPSTNTHSERQSEIPRYARNDTSL